VRSVAVREQKPTAFGGRAVTDDWVRIARHYAARDLSLIIGGASVLLCLDFCFPRVRINIVGYDVSGPEYLLLAGIAYVLGYFIQEILSVLFPDWITTSTQIKPSRVLKWVYERYTHAELDWAKQPDCDEDEATIYINTKQSERNQADYERMTGHLVMCMAIGSCWVVVGFILIGRTLFIRNGYVFPFGVAISLLGCCLVFLGKVKAVRIRKFRHDLIKGFTLVRSSLQKAQRAKESPDFLPRAGQADLSDSCAGNTEP
jgi:hypothetical protein